MKILILIIVLLIITFNKSFNQEIEWVEMISFSSERFSMITDYAIDESGNVYISGTFDSDTIFFNNDKYLTRIQEKSRYNNFFAKYDKDGKCLWAEKISGINDLCFPYIRIDKKGDIYLLGEMFPNSPFSDTIRFNNGISVHTNRYTDVFSIIAKFNSEGNCQWAEGINGSICGIVIDKFNDLIVAGSFMSLLEFNNGFSLKNKSRPSGMGRDGFLAKYDDNGKCKGAEQISGWGTESIGSPRLLANDYIRIGTYTNDSDTIQFNNDIQLVFPKNIYERRATAIYNLNGICESAKIDSTSSSSNRVFDSKGNYYICDSFKGDSITLNDEITLYNRSYWYNHNDIYITKYDSENNILWAHTITGIDDDQIVSFIVDNKDNLIITGQFSSDEIFFNNGFQLQRIKINKDYYNYFSATYDENGNCQYAVLTGKNDYRPKTNNSGTPYIIDNFLGDTLVIDNKKYYYRNSHNNDTIKSSGVYIIKLKNTPNSVSIHSEQENMIIFPNPSSDFITIQLSNKGLQSLEAVEQVQIFDILGIEVMSDSIHPMTSSHLMNVEKLPAGVYFIKVGNQVKKFVKL